MSDPRRLLDDPTLSPLARATLCSAADDGPAPDRRRAIAAALGLSAGGGAVATAAATGLWWKVPLVVAALAGAGTTTYVWSRGVEPRATPQAAAPISIVATAPTAPTSPTLAIAPPTPTPTPPPAAPSAPAPAQTPAPAPPPAPHAAHVTHRAPPPTTTVEADDSAPRTTDDTVGATTHVDPRSLAAEVALLDRARAALQRGDTAGADAALDLHGREFPGGALVAEAELLRVQTAVARGDRAGAAALAQRFLTRFPDSPLAPRARAILDGATRSP